MSNVQPNYRPTETVLPKGGEWRSIAQQRAASGQTLAPLNPLPVGTSYAKVISCTESPARNRSDFFIYRVHLLACDQTGSKFYLPGTDKVVDNEKQAVFSISMEVSSVLYCDDHQGEIVEINTVAGRTANNSTVNKQGIAATEQTAVPHSALQGKSTAVISEFQSLLKGKNPSELSDNIVQKLVEKAEEAVALLEG